MGSETTGLGYGFVSYTLTPNNLYIQTSFSGAQSDSARIITGPGSVPTPPPTIAGSSFSFASTGRFARTADTAATLNRIASSGTDFALANGDFSYAGAGSEPASCSFGTSRVGASYALAPVGWRYADAGREASLVP